jgi:hypothetical protein
MGARVPYNGSLTREQFLFYEMRTVAKLIVSGKNDEEIIEEVYKENLFQYPTEKTLKNLTRVCLKRLHALEDNVLIETVANQPVIVAKQVCLYAIMKQNRVMWEFMVTVIGEKYRHLNMAFSNMDLNVFFMRLQEQNDEVASWKESTIDKMKSVIKRILIENDYIDNGRATVLNPVLICSVLENTIRSNNDEQALLAFNCFS